MALCVSACKTVSPPTLGVSQLQTHLFQHQNEESIAAFMLNLVIKFTCIFLINDVYFLKLAMTILKNHLGIVFLELSCIIFCCPKNEGIFILSFFFFACVCIFLYQALIICFNFKYRFKKSKIILYCFIVLMCLPKWLYTANIYGVPARC